MLSMTEFEPESSGVGFNRFSTMLQAQPPCQTLCSPWDHNNVLITISAQNLKYTFA